ncbi:TPA: 50S ribosomal protein L30e [Candidatus Micrarchaeota archaeon]|nr:50S ribosomal protein L30e [Candidatus Micrarchaeota archaeon]
MTEAVQNVEVSEEEEEKPKKKRKKVVRRRKSKKEKERPLTSALRLTVESGKVEFGARTGLVASLLGKAKVFVLAENTPAETRTRVSTYAQKSGIPVIVYDGTTMELGSVCGKPFPVSVLSVYDVGTSNLMDLAKK